MTKSKKKASAKQLAARAKFSRIMKSGGFGKKKKKSSKSHSKSKKLKLAADRTIKKFDSTMRLKDVNKKELSEVMALIRAIQNPKIKEITIKK